MNAIVDGQVVKVGDVVGFKSDYEQHGQIVAIKQSLFGNSKILVLENKNGFHGDYIGGETVHTESAVDCWLN